MEISKGSIKINFIDVPILYFVYFPMFCMKS